MLFVGMADRKPQGGGGVESTRPPSRIRVNCSNDYVRLNGLITICFNFE